jgi:hypothetical protein
LPQSSEQILHAEKYFSYEAPQKLTLPELQSALGPAWKKLDYDVNGEWGCYLILNEFLNDAEESKQASAGWAGDRFALYESGKPDEVFVAQLTAWDTPLDAQEFFNAYARRTAKRYPDAKELKSDDNRFEWQTSTGKVVMELRGSRVAIVEGVPSSTDANKLLNAIWPQR